MSEKPVNNDRKNKRAKKRREPAHSQLSSLFFIALVEFYFPFPNFSLFAADLFQALYFPAPACSAFSPVVGEAVEEVGVAEETSSSSSSILLSLLAFLIKLPSL